MKSETITRIHITITNPLPTDREAGRKVLVKKKRRTCEQPISPEVVIMGA
jgi:hypothetical protein